VRQDLEAKGHQAAALLHRLIMHNLGATFQVTMPVELIIRASS